jgi:hypothetical protein
MADHVEYVYAVVEARASLGAFPEGVDDAPVRLESDGEIAALVSSLDGDDYSAPTVETRTAEIDWLAPRARAHDRVITWASERGPVVPLPMFSLFHDAEGVRGMLRRRRGELANALARVRGREEYGVRVFRIDAAVAGQLGALSPRIAEIERAAAAASPGQRYLLERKLDTERGNELRRVGTEVAQRIYDALAARADDAIIEPLPRRAPDDAVGTAVLNAAFLVRRDATEAFRRELTRLIEDHEPRGFRFEFTGPWPPYHFAGDRSPRAPTEATGAPHDG